MGEFTRSSSRLETAMRQFMEVFPCERMERMKKRRNLGLMVKEDEAAELDAMASMLRQGMAALSVTNVDTECLSEVQPEPGSENTSPDCNMPLPFVGETISAGSQESKEPGVPGPTIQTVSDEGNVDVVE